jgi:lipopolysaccharide export system protein LptC
MVLRADPDPISSAHQRKAHPVKHAGHHRYTRFVGIMKIALPASAVVLLGLVVVWPKLMRDVDRFKIGFASLQPTAVETLSMVNARFQGLDNTNRPYTLTADKATEQNTKSGIVLLDNPKADFVTRTGTGIYVEARHGVYHQAEKLLDLEGEVSLYQDEGNEMHTERARVNLATSSVEGDLPVTGNGPQGRLAGTGFRIDENGKRLVLTGQSEFQMKGARVKTKGARRK